MAGGFGTFASLRLTLSGIDAQHVWAHSRATAGGLAMSEDCCPWLGLALASERLASRLASERLQRPKSGEFESILHLIASGVQSFQDVSEFLVHLRTIVYRKTSQRPRIVHSSPFSRTIAALLRSSNYAKPKA